MTTIEFATLKKYAGIISSLTGIECRIFDHDKVEENAKYLQYRCDGCDCALRECYDVHANSMQHIGRELGSLQYVCPKGFTFIAMDFYVRSVPIGCIIIGPVQLAYGNEARLSNVPSLSSSQYNNLQNLLHEIVTLYNASSYSVSTDLSVDVLPSVSFRPIIDGYSQYNIDLENQLIKMVGNGFGAQTTSVITQIIDNLFTVTALDTSEVRKRVEEIAYLISRCAINNGARLPESFHETNKYHSEIKHLKEKSDFVAFLSDVVASFASIGKVRDVKVNDKGSAVIQLVHEYVNAHYSEKITLDQVAAYCQISQSHLCTLLNNKLGYTFTQYVNFIRIEKSKELLAQTNDPVGVVAEKCGFNGQSYFTQVFKTFIGKNPCIFRREAMKARGARG